MDIIEKYRDFIIDNLEIPTHIRLLHVDNSGDKVISTKIKHHFDNGKFPVEVNIINKYSRSFEYEILFDKYKIVNIFYLSRHFSPIYLLDKFDNDINELVNNKLLEYRRFDIYEKYNSLNKIKYILPKNAKIIN